MVDSKLYIVYLSSVPMIQSSQQFASAWRAQLLLLSIFSQNMRASFIITCQLTLNEENCFLPRPVWPYCQRMSPHRRLTGCPLWRYDSVQLCQRTQHTVWSRRDSLHSRGREIIHLQEDSSVCRHHPGIYYRDTSCKIDQGNHLTLTFVTAIP